jgi:hypothetical protein
MDDFDKFERDLGSALRSDADESFGTFEAASIARAAIAGSQRRFLRLAPRSSRGEPTGRNRGITLFAVAAAVMLVGGALVAGSGLLQRTTVIPSLPVPSFAQLAIASPNASPTHAPHPSASQPPSPSPVSLKLAWTQVALDATFADGRNHTPRIAWVGDRFVLADMDSGAVSTSADGANWQPLLPTDAAPGYVHLLRGSISNWQDTFVGVWHPQDGPDTTNTPPTTARDVVTIAHPPAAPISTTPFRGSVESIGIGPKGIVAEVHSVLDLQAITDTAQDGGVGWYSPTGEHWTQMAPRHTSSDLFGARLPTGGFGDVVGVSDGFIANADAAIWYSADGLTWRLLGHDPNSTFIEGLLPWMGGALVRNGPAHFGVYTQALVNNGSGHVDLWTSAGLTKLPVPADLGGTVGIGPLGIFVFDASKAWVSRNGIDYGMSLMPAQIADANHGGTHYPATVAVGDRTILVLERDDPQTGRITWSLWLGAFEP